MLKENFIGERLRELRGSSSLREMAESVGIKYSAWARYEAGGSLPGADILSRICRVHSCSADWLLGIERGTSAAPPGEMPACAKCPHLKKLKKFEELLKQV